MANVAISDMPNAATLTGPEQLAGVQSGANVNVTAAQIKTFTSASPILVTPALGTPASGTLTNATGLPLATGITGTLAVANGGTGVTSSTGTGNVVLSTSPTLVTPALGTPASGVLTNATGLPIVGGTTGTLTVARGGTGLATITAHGVLIGAGTGNVAPTTAGTTGQVLTSNGASADPTFQAPAVASGHDAQTAVAGAATSSAPNVLVTSEALVAGTSYTLTLTDALIASTSIIQCTVWPSTGVATGVQITGITPGPGSATIAVAMAALTGTVKFMISIFN